MVPTSTAASLSILEDGELKPGIYKIQNISSKTFLDYEVHTRELCCRLVNELEEDKGLWEVKRLGPGYTIQRVEPGRPEQFCAPLTGLEDGNILSISAYPVAWRVEIADDDIYRGEEYVRFYWGTTKKLWYASGGTDKRLKLWLNTEFYSSYIWRLIPVKVEDESAPSRPSSEVPGWSSLPSYDGDGTGRSSTHTLHAESELDDFGTVVTEVTTTLVTTRKRYRVEGA